jgi:hypothetical protein
MRNRRTSTQSRKGTDMTAIALTESSLLNAKRALSAGLPTEKSSHLTEALAAACGYQTHAALLAALRGGNEADPDFVLLDDASFVRRLSQLTGGADVRKNGFAGFERLEYPSRHEIVRTQSVELGVTRWSRPSTLASLSVSSACARATIAGRARAKQATTNPGSRMHTVL